MFIDGLLLFDTATAITTTQDSYYTLDMTDARDMGIGDNEPLKVWVQVSTAFTTTNAATLTVAFLGSTDDTTYTTYAQSRAYAAAELLQGKKLLEIGVPRPGGTAAIPRYLKLTYTVGTGIFSAGNITAGLVESRHDHPDYAPGVVVNN